MDTLRRRWWIPLIVTLGLSLTIYALASKYTSAQTAADATAFKDAVFDAGDGRTRAAGLVDMAFVLSYVVLAVALTRDHLVTKIGAGIVILGAVADQVENGLVIAAIGKGRAVTDNAVDNIRTAGTFKWTLIGIGVVVHVVGLVLQSRMSESNCATAD